MANFMGGKGRWMDNVMIERIWRSVKWVCLYLREVETAAKSLKYFEIVFSSIAAPAYSF